MFCRRSKLSDSIKDLKFTAAVQTLKPSRKVSVGAESEPLADAQDEMSAGFQESLDNADASEVPGEGDEQPTSSSSNALPVPLRHPSLMVKCGVLNFKKSSTAKMAPRWCSLNMFKFQIFTRDQSTSLLSLLMATLERVESGHDPQSAAQFSVSLHRKRKYRSAPIVVIASSAGEQQEWLAVTPLFNAPAHVAPGLFDYARSSNRVRVHTLRYLNPRLSQIFNEILTYHRQLRGPPSELERTWRE